MEQGGTAAGPDSASQQVDQSAEGSSASLEQVNRTVKEPDLAVERDEKAEEYCGSRAGKCGRV